MTDKFWMQPESTELGSWQKEIKDITGSDTFCVLPWIHFSTRPNGDMRLCCSANASGAGKDHLVGLIKSEDGKPANFGSTTPIAAWNNTYMKSVRKNMKEGHIPKSCSKCFYEEKEGVSSKRIWETKQWADRGIDLNELIELTSDEGAIPEKLVYLDLRLGHTCNLKCVMCSPHDSSKWVSDHKVLYPKFQSPLLKSQMSWNKNDFNNFWHENPEFWEEIYSQIPNLQEVYFAGGEPLMIKEHRYFIEEIVRRGYQDKIVLRYNSNGTLLDKDLIDLWSKFKTVRFGVSIDATEDRNFYIRYPTEWDTIENNLRILDETPNNIEVSIATAIQILNIKHMPDFVKWKVNSKFKKVNAAVRLNNWQIGGGLINTHLLYIPTWLSLRVLPLEDKREVEEQFAELRSWLFRNYTSSNSFWEQNPYGWRRWEGVLKFMFEKDDSAQLKTFQEYINSLDKLRGTNFKATFPELAHLL